MLPRLLHPVSAQCSAPFSYVMPSLPQADVDRQVMMLSRPELWLRGAPSLCGGGRKEAGSDPAFGVLPSSDIGGRRPGWVHELGTFQPCISFSDPGSSLRCFGWLLGREGGLNEL